MANIPRPEHPKPQFEREEWINLNGTWTFELDHGKSGVDRMLKESKGFAGEITVPFCPESRLSGVGHTDFIEMMWYHRQLEIPASWKDKKIVLHFGAVDFECEIFIDGVSVGKHWGGSASFSCDISNAAAPGSTHNLVLYIRDEVRSGFQAGGKQCPDFASHGCAYTRTTGIWQTVWLEAVDPLALKNVHIIPDLDSGSFTFIPRYYSLASDSTLSVRILDNGDSVVESSVKATDGIPVTLTLTDPKPWQPGSPHLYDVELTVTAAGREVDKVKSYAGLRKVHIEGNKILLNNKPFYQRLVLDQGFYPEGIWTAPTDEDLKRDIELSMEAGFNGARLHQKVFEERFHYWGDKLGYVTWGESASWGLDLSTTTAARNFLSEWREIILRDRNHPSIIAWSPYNESRSNVESRQHGRAHFDAYEISRGLDPTRPVNDSSGYIHYTTDIYTVHNYEQDPAKLKAYLDPDVAGEVFRNFPEYDEPYNGQPYIIDEFGGIGWNPKRDIAAEGNDPSESWGYGNAPRTLEEFYTRLEEQVQAVVSLKHMCGFCYTQLTDVEQEQNGIYYYDRTKKFDMARIRKAFTQEGV